MNQTAIPPMNAEVLDRVPRSLESARPQLSLHGSEPGTGMPMTWHVTSLYDDGAATAYLIERADGDIHSPAVWMQAHREAVVVDHEAVLDLVRNVMFVSEADQE